MHINFQPEMPSSVTCDTHHLMSTGEMVGVPDCPNY